MEIMSETPHYNLENNEKKPLKNSSFLAFFFRQQELEFKTIRLDFLIAGVAEHGQRHQQSYFNRQSRGRP
jgi:hypothetical protein